MTTFSGSYMKRRGEILADPATSMWLKQTLLAAEGRDPGDVLNDIEVLQGLAQLRFDTACRVVGTLAQIGPKAVNLSGDLVWLVERAQAILRSGKAWTAAEEDRSWADWEKRAAETLQSVKEAA